VVVVAGIDPDAVVGMLVRVGLKAEGIGLIWAVTGVGVTFDGLPGEGVTMGVPGPG
jgi:hypothetical protein